MGKYDNLLLKDLRAELRRRGKKLSGKKADLIQRLEFYDYNDVQTDMEQEYNMDLPCPVQDYRDLNADSSIPDVTTGRINGFLSSCDKTLDRKCKQMYKDRSLRYVRMALADAGCYVMAAVWAEMKKGTSYKVDILLAKDGVVSETQCECAVGQGPSAHCKHVCTLLVGLNSFLDEGNILTEQTCTQVPQTFHKPAKAWVGSPMKVSTMARLRHPEKDFSFDPRAEEFRSGKWGDTEYRNFFQNACVNYNAQNPACRMPVMQLFPIANPYAVHDDHDYMSLHPAHKFFVDANLEFISEEKAASIERATINQASNQLWKDQRTMRITASKVGEICKATVRRNKQKLADDLTARKIIHSKSVHWGTSHEDDARKKFEKLTGKTSEPCGLFISAETPYLAATPDGLVGSDAVLEIKCPFAARNKSVMPRDIDYLELQDGDLCLKTRSSYYYQIQTQLYCTRRSIAYFVVWTTKDCQIIEITKQEGFVQEMLDLLELFYTDYFKDACVDRHLYNNYKKHFH